MFLGVTCEVANYVEKDNCFSLILNDNPLIDFVELPKHLQGLYYSNIICGVIRGALEAVTLMNFMNSKFFRYNSKSAVTLLKIYLEVMKPMK